MALLKCRTCAAEINSDDRVTRCKGCGSLFPFECNVCNRNLRPPFPVYSDERYLDEADHPLCSDHFQRQCPTCQTWFQADQNAGYFMCKPCLAIRESSLSNPPASLAAPTAAPIAAPSDAPAHFPRWDQSMVPNADNVGTRDLGTLFLFVVVCLSMVAVIGVLIWQVVSLLRLMSGA